MTTYITFALSITLLIMSPGPVVSLVIAESRYSFPRHTVAGALISSQLLLITSLLFILFAFRINPMLMNILQFVGGTYLLYMAWNSFRHTATLETVEKNNPARQFWMSLKIGLSNPKDILFFIAFLPTFMVINDSFLSQSIHLMLIWLMIDFLIMSMYSLLAQKIFMSSIGRFVINYLPTFSILGFGFLALYRSIHGLF